jgi:hypothetical protein
VLLADQALEVAVGGADQRHVDLLLVARAQRRHPALLQHAQQARLQGQRHVADLVEEQRAAVGLHQAPDHAATARTGEGAFAVAEQLGLDQPFGIAAQLTATKGLSPRAGLVQARAMTSLPVPVSPSNSTGKPLARPGGPCAGHGPGAHHRRPALQGLGPGRFCGPGVRRGAVELGVAR